MPSIQNNAIMAVMYLPFFLFICFSFFIRVYYKNYKKKSKLLKSIKRGYHAILGWEISTIIFQLFAISSNTIEVNGEFILSKVIHLSLLYICFRFSKKSLPPLIIPLIYGAVWNIILIILPWLAAFAIVDDNFINTLYSSIKIYHYHLFLIFLITQSIFSRFEYNLLIKNNLEINNSNDNDNEFTDSLSKGVADYKNLNFNKESEIKIDNTYNKLLEDEISDNDFKQLKKYKKMLDTGLIDQDDYEQKKKKILGLD